jgi:DNA (cytosine-5)-methyltransferase 1
MTHKEKLLEIYKKSFDISDISNIPDFYRTHLNHIGKRINSGKGVYTVLITLLTHKLLYKSQDIRKHQENMVDGFSGRSIDTKFITPTLKELDLPSMAESGWLTRSLEQPYPYTLGYEGKISGKGIKEAFLNILDFIEKNPRKTRNVLRILLNYAIKTREENQIEIIPLRSPDKLTISKIIRLLDSHFNKNYGTYGGSKLPVLALYAIYKILISELDRFDGCLLKPMGSHTASDRTSYSSGDIEVEKNNAVFESVEIKLNKAIDENMIRIAYEKIKRFNPSRYYVLSYIGVKDADREKMEKIIAEIENQHGCQLIINGVLPTLEYYMRLISSVKYFFDEYRQLVEEDKELKPIHKQELNKLIKRAK